MRRISLAFVVLAACESAVVLPSAEATSTGVDASPSTGAETSAASSGVPQPSTSSSTTGTFDPATTSTSSGAAESDGDDGGCSFLCEPDGGSPLFECDTFDQDCPPGEKCAPWMNDDGSSWEALRCVRVAPDPDEPGEPCTREGQFDTCAVGSFCWGVDAETGEGTCVSHCVGSEAAPTCADPTRVCDLDLEGFLHLCVAWCDPVDPNACPEGTDGCFAIDDGFVCVPDGTSKGGELFDTCELINGCSPGLRCADPDDGGMLCEPDAPGCCLPYCNLDDPSCPAMTGCTPFFEDGAAYPQFEHVGVCTAEAE